VPCAAAARRAVVVAEAGARRRHVNGGPIATLSPSQADTRVYRPRGPRVEAERRRGLRRVVSLRQAATTVFALARAHATTLCSLHTSVAAVQDQQHGLHSTYNTKFTMFYL
jgi:hypothetical protein